MLTPEDLREFSTESILRRDQASRLMTEGTVDMICKQEILREAISDVLTADEPLQRFCELAALHPKTMNLVLSAGLFVLEQVHDGKIQKDEIQRRADLN